MRRALPILVLLAFLVPAASAYGDGCPSPCSGQSSSPPGTKLLFVQPDGPTGRLVAYDTSSGRPVFAFPPGRASLLAAVSRNGRTLYFSNGRLLWAYDAAYARVRGPYATGREIVGLGYGADDRRLHVVREDGVMLTFDAATGRQTTR
jgi:hypothetical protein